DLNRLTRLFQAIAQRDWHSADTIASEVASGEERIGHHAAAQRLRGALHPNGRPRPSEADLEPAERRNSTFFLANALTQVPADRELTDLRLKSRTRSALRELIAEWRCRDQLAARGIERRTKLLFHGPPGCGKSVTARAVGHELNLPVYVVRFDAIVGAYLGQ